MSISDDDSRLGRKEAEMQSQPLTGPVRVMLVEDHADFRRAMVSLLERQPEIEVVAQAGSLDEARHHIASVGCDVAILDLGLPDGNGTDLIAELREVCPGSAVLILSASLDADNRARTREAAADEVLDKFVNPAEVVGAVMRLGKAQTPD